MGRLQNANWGSVLAQADRLGRTWLWTPHHRLRCEHQTPWGTSYGRSLGTQRTGSWRPDTGIHSYIPVASTSVQCRRRNPHSAQWLWRRWLCHLVLRTDPCRYGVSQPASNTTRLACWHPPRSRGSRRGRGWLSQQREEPPLYHQERRHVTHGRQRLQWTLSPR